ncbi:hypothetical protein B0H67DRAFT_662692 [Lasiosphaeris hirsuta]|uniref:Uncharacterized protein n=1 Tax=Lasiosphaeris hirsuta TaxID=260670 RepID=A0AA40AR49_9PEZI|nr:hypothetical protein B0H67DRAFT_662692 [Lasiosphaeris hirsuta]
MPTGDAKECAIFPDSGKRTLNRGRWGASSEGLVVKTSQMQLVESKPDNDPQTVRFTNVQDLFNRINHTTRDSLTVTGVSLNRFTEIELTREEQGHKFHIRDYDSNSRILIITIPTHLHEQLHKPLYNKNIRQVHDSSWKDIGSATQSAQVHSGQSRKEGNSTGGSKPERAAKGAWPTLVIEAGRWFSMSNHVVKIVILVKFDEMPVRPGATTTRRSLHQEPVLRQSITITQNTTTNPISYNVIRGALVLPFRLLFLRDPGPKLERYAENV